MPTRSSRARVRQFSITMQLPPTDPSVAWVLPQRLAARLAARRAAGLWRSRTSHHGATGSPASSAQGRPCIAFRSNDYLGLAADPRLAAAAADAAQCYGVGAGASHFVGGHHQLHDELEKQLAEWTGRDRVLLFSCGYMANVGIIAALAQTGDTVVQDRLNHASLLDGALLSQARLMRYRHADAGSAALQISRASRPVLLVTDGVFSMDGDIAPLSALARHCEGTDILFMVDDAHGLGVVGPEGRGVCGLQACTTKEVPLLVGTFGKAFGTGGAFVAGPASLIEFLEQFTRTSIYTTALPLPITAATLRSLQILRVEEGRRERLRTLIRAFREGVLAQGWSLLPSQTPIQPILMPSAERAVWVADRLRDAGLLVAAIRPPTVPAGSSRLRITLSAAHELKDVQRLLDALAPLIDDNPELAHAAAH